MLQTRLIPCLLLRRGGLVKTTRFADAKYVGDPINAIRIFNDKEVDELMVLDIVASKEGREPDYALIEQFASECFMPLCYGGGVRSLEQARRLFALGVEKLCIQEAAMSDPSLITRITDNFGAQSVSISIDVKRNWRGKPALYRASTGKTLGPEWLERLQHFVQLGAGEVVLNAVQRDGTMSGMDVALIRQASAAVSVPLIAIGGAGTLEHIREAIEAGASAVAAGAFFVYHGPHRAVLITYPSQSELASLQAGSRQAGGAS